MDDLEICKRIAEIEGKEIKLSIDGKNWLDLSNPKDIYSHSRVFGGYKNFNPLTDDALCFQLMVKYELKLEPCATFGWVAWYEDNYCIMWDCTDKSPNKAICLAIIEKHNK